MKAKAMETIVVAMGIAIVFVTMFAAPGCGTFVNQTSNREIYGGVRWDIREIQHGSMFPKTVMVMDVPFSLVGDTILLPCDALAYAHRTKNDAAKK